MLQPFPILIRAALIAGAAQYIRKLYKKRDMGSLDGSQWQILTRGQNDLKQTISFGPNSELNGFGGCNHFFGQYTQDGDKLTIGALAATRKAGPHLKAEAKLLTALQNTRRFKGNVTHIALYSEDDTISLRLKRISGKNSS